LIGMVKMGLWPVLEEMGMEEGGEDGVKVL
jgi:hypothetical protein